MNILKWLFGKEPDPNVITEAEIQQDATQEYFEEQEENRKAEKQRLKAEKKAAKNKK